VLAVLSELFFVQASKKIRQYFVYYRIFLRSMGGKEPVKTGFISVLYRPRLFQFNFNLFGVLSR